MYGYTDLVGKSFNVLLPSPIREQHDRYVRDYLRTKQSRFLGKVRLVMGVHASGHLQAFTMYVRWADEAMGRMIAVMQVLGNTHEVCVIFDEQDRLLHATANLHSIFGFSRRDILGRKLLLADVIPALRSDDEDNDHARTQLLSPRGLQCEAAHHLTQQRFRVHAHVAVHHAYEDRYSVLRCQVTQLQSEAQDDFDMGLDAPALDTQRTQTSVAIASAADAASAPAAAAQEEELGSDDDAASEHVGSDSEDCVDAPADPRIGAVADVLRRPVAPLILSAAADLPPSRSPTPSPSPTLVHSPRSTTSAASSPRESRIPASARSSNAGDSSAPLLPRSRQPSPRDASATQLEALPPLPAPQPSRAGGSSVSGASNTTRRNKSHKRLQKAIENDNARTLKQLSLLRIFSVVMVAALVALAATGAGLAYQAIDRSELLVGNIYRSSLRFAYLVDAMLTYRTYARFVRYNASRLPLVNDLVRRQPAKPY
jgi:hypothetical protein